MSFNIIGTGSACPKSIVTNDDLAKFMDTSDEWIRTRTGIKERRVSSKDESSTKAILLFMIRTIPRS